MAFTIHGIYLQQYCGYILELLTLLYFIALKLTYTYSLLLLTQYVTHYLCYL